MPTPHALPSTSKRRGAALVSPALLALVVTVLGWGAPGPVRAQTGQPNGYTAGELALLPEYCKDVQGVFYGDATNASPRAAQWIALMGNDFWHMHHYCRGLAMISRADRPGQSASQRAYFHARAMSEFDYLFKNVSPSTPLMPEIFLKYGELNLVLDNLPEAKVGFDRARELKPDYWPAYTRWIDVLLKLKQFDQARALAEQGLQYLPDNTELQARLAAASRGHTPAATSQQPKKKPGANADKKAESVVAATPSK